jgi:hypothetical protein
MNVDDNHYVDIDENCDEDYDNAVQVFVELRG